MVQLSGDLTGMGLPPLVKFLANVRATGRLALDIEPDVNIGTVFVEDGRVVGATLQSEEGLPALEGMALVSNQARFALSDRADQIQHNLEADTTALQEHLDHIAREGVELTRKIPSLRAVPRLIVGEDPHDYPVALTRAEVQVLVDLPRRCSVIELARSHGLRDTLRHLGRLIDLRLVAVDSDITFGGVPTHSEPTMQDHSLPRALAQSMLLNG